MHKIHIKIFCVSCAFLWQAPFGHAQGKYTLDEVFAKIDEVQKTFKSVAADIERTHVTVLVNDKDVSFGKFYYTRRGKEPRLKLELLSPTMQYLLIDKGKLQLYTPKLKQVQEAAITGHQDKVELFMSLGFGQSSQELKSNFDVAVAPDEVIDAKKTSVLELKPKNSGIPFKIIRMWMDQDKWLAVQIRTTESGGDYGIFKFSNVKMNSGFSESVFDLKMPKDVHVMKL